MPAKTKRQQKFMGAELSRLRSGRRTKTGMSERQLEEFARKKKEWKKKEKKGKKGKKS